MFGQLIRAASKLRKRSRRQRRGQPSRELSRNNRLSIESLEPRCLLAPVISGTTCTPTAPTAGNTATIASTITDTASISSATLTYSYTGSVTSTAFYEGFSSGSTGSGLVGAMNAWTATANRSPNDVSEQGGAANHTAAIVLSNCTTTSGSTTVTCRPRRASFPAC